MYNDKKFRPMDFKVNNNFEFISETFHIRCSVNSFVDQRKIIEEKEDMMKLI